MAGSVIAFKAMRMRNRGGHDSRYGRISQIPVAWLESPAVSSDHNGAVCNELVMRHQADRIALFAVTVVKILWCTGKPVDHGHVADVGHMRDIDLPYIRR